MSERDKPVNQGRHEAGCKICAHPEREQIEAEWCAWANTSELAKQYGLSRDSIYRHVAAFNLHERRARNLRAALERIIEQADGVTVNAAAVLSAGSSGTAVTLDGSASSDPDGDSLTYTWTGPFTEGGGTATGVSPTVILQPGESTITLVVNDGTVDSDPDTVHVLIKYGFLGFLQPVDKLPTINVAKAGSAIPVKWGLGDDQGMGVFAPGYPISGKIQCDTAQDADVIEQTVTAGSSSLQYDAAADQYVYIWKTEKVWAGTCRKLVILLKDGTYHQANFRFTR